MWLLLQDPELAITIDSESDRKAQMLLASLAAVLSGEDKFSGFSKLYGGWASESNSYRWNKQAIDVSQRKNLARKEPSIGTCSVESGITMQHPDVFILDDPTSYEKLRQTSEWKTMVNEHVESMVPVFGEGSLWLWPGTRYGDDDHYGTFLKSEGVASVSGPGELPDVDITPNGEWHVYYLPGITGDGRLTMPHIWSRKRIDSWTTRNPIKCASQVRLDPFESAINPLTVAQAETCYINDDDKIPWRMMDFSFHFDLAFKRPDRFGRGDLTSFISWGHMRDGSGQIVLDSALGSNSWQAADLAARVVIEYQRLKKNGCYVKIMTCEQEAGGGQGLWQQHLQNTFASANLVMPRFEYIRRAGKHADKTERLIGAAAFWRDGRVRIPRGRAGAAELVSQMTRIMGTKRKDYADAAADVFNPIVYRAMHASLSNDSAPRVENLHDELLKGNPNVTEWYAGRVHEQEALDGMFEPI